MSDFGAYESMRAMLELQNRGLIRPEDGGKVASCIFEVIFPESFATFQEALKASTDVTIERL